MDHPQETTGTISHEGPRWWLIARTVLLVHVVIGFVVSIMLIWYIDRMRASQLNALAEDTRTLLKKGVKDRADAKAELKWHHQQVRHHQEEAKRDLEAMRKTLRAVESRLKKLEARQ